MDKTTGWMTKLTGFFRSDQNAGSANAASAKYQKISPAEAKKLMEDEEACIILDVRTPSEHSENHIQGAMLIPHTEIKKRAEQELPDKDCPILVYCLSGARSKKAANTLVKLGYAKVKDIGGISSWPYDIVRSK